MKFLELYQKGIVSPSYFAPLLFGNIKTCENKFYRYVKFKWTQELDDKAMELFVAKWMEIKMKSFKDIYVLNIFKAGGLASIVYPNNAIVSARKNILHKINGHRKTDSQFYRWTVSDETKAMRKLNDFLEFYLK